MKNIITLLVLVFAFTFTTQAQRKDRKASPKKMLKKMTKELNLTEAQQGEIKVLLETQFAERKALNEQRKAMKEAGEKPTKELRKEMREEKAAKQTAMNTKMASILNPEQLKKFEAIAKERKEKMKKKRKKMRKEKKENNDN